MIGQIALRLAEVELKHLTEQLLNPHSTVDKSVRERNTKKKAATEMFVQVSILNETTDFKPLLSQLLSFQVSYFS